MWRKTASLPQTDGSIVLARWRQCAHMGGHIGVTWPIQLNLCFLRLTRVHNPNGKLIGSAVIAQFTPEGPNGRPFPRKLPILVGDLDPQSNSWFLEPDRAHNPNGITIGSAVFLHVTADCPYTLQWVPLSPNPSHGGSGPPSNTQFLRPIRAHKPNGIPIGSAIFVQMTAECPCTLQWNAPFPP